MHALPPSLGRSEKPEAVRRVGSWWSLSQSNSAQYPLETEVCETNGTVPGASEEDGVGMGGAGLGKDSSSACVRVLGEP